jgi:hypothetical protein
MNEVNVLDTMVKLKVHNIMFVCRLIDECASTGEIM